MCSCREDRPTCQLGLCGCTLHGAWHGRPRVVIGGTRAGKTSLSDLLAADFMDDAAERRRAEADARTAAEGRPAQSIPGEVLAREDAPARRPDGRSRPVRAILGP